MPPKKPTTTTKTAAPKSTAGSKGGAAKRGTKAAPSGSKAPPQSKPVAEPPKLKPVPEKSMPVKKVISLLMGDSEGSDEKDPMWPYIIDSPEEIVKRFVTHRDVNMLSILQMNEKDIKLALLAALRYGKAFIIDITDLDFSTASAKFEEILEGLTEMLLSKKIMDDENIPVLIEKFKLGSDEFKITDFKNSEFRFAVLTAKQEVSDEVKSKMQVIRTE